MATRKNHKKTKKLFRKTRSKRQRGSGTQFSSQADVNAKDDYGSTALHRESEKGDVEKVGSLLRQPGIDVNVRNNHGNTSLIIASRTGRTETVKLLLEQPEIDVNVKGKYDQTALMQASRTGRTEIVKNLLEKGADIMLKDNENQTALDMLQSEDIHFPEVETAIVEHKKEIARLLRERHEALLGVALRLETQNPSTPAAKVLGQTVTVRKPDGRKQDIHHFARKINEYVGGKRKYRSKKQGGAKMPYVGRYYENPRAKLWDGVYEDDYKMVEEAFKEGASFVNDNSRWWFLTVASDNGNARIVNLLLEKGIDVNITDDENDTALSIAVRNAKYDVVELLLEKGADINKENNDGDTPLMHAIIFEDYDMVELLLEHPYINIELDLDTNKELALAEELTPEDEEQNGIPYLIEDYIVTKNKIKEHKYKNIKRISNYKRPNVPKLSTLAHRQLSTRDTIQYNNAVKDNTVPPLDGKLGGKRKTRKAKKFRRSKKSKRKTRKSKKH